MLDTILNALKQKQISAFRLIEEKEESAELFYIKKRLDMHREKKVKRYSVIVYRDFSVPASEGGDPLKMRGSSGFRIEPGMNAEEIEKAIDSAWYAASFVKNPFYEIPKNITSGHVVMDSTLCPYTPAEAAARMAGALFAADSAAGDSAGAGCTEKNQAAGARINSAEIFAVRHTMHILNSEGVDVSYESKKVKGEFIVQCREPLDVELYQSFSYDGLEEAALSKKAVKALSMAEQRAKAVSAPSSGTYDVILSNSDIGHFFDYYRMKTGSSSVYAKYSDFQVGTAAQGEEAAGDRVTIALKAEEPFSIEGIPMKDRTLLDRGEVRLISGGARFAYYLGIEPTGDYDKIEVAPGSLSLAALREEAGKETGRFLEIVSFSDFQMDPISGFFGGEIRLAFLHENGTVTPVTGGSLQGSILKAQQDMYLSQERMQEEGYEGPASILLKSLNVAGV